MIRVAFILESADSAAAHYRVLANVDAFEKHGVDLYPMLLARSAPGRKRMFQDLAFFDAAVLQRKLLQPWQFNYLRRRVRVLGYDFDDALLYRDSPFMGHFSLSRRMKFRKVAQGVDFVTAGNRYLVNLTGRPGVRAYVVPTPVDTSLYRPRETEKTPVRIGWVGSRSNLKYLKSILPAIERVAEKRPGVTLTVLSDAFPEEKPYIRRVEWKRETEPVHVAAFDVGVMPLEDDVWTRGKCGFKLLLYGACGIPSVASPVGANSEIIVEGETGLLASGLADWEKALLDLVDDPEKRQALGRAARARVESNYSTISVIPAWAGILKRMVGAAGA